MADIMENPEEQPTQGVVTSVIPAGSTTPINYNPVDVEKYGHTIRVSKLCPVCRDSRVHAIQLARAKDFKSYKEIAAEFGLAPEAIRKHFEDHYSLSNYSLQLINLKEDTTPEAKVLITRLFEGSTDLLDGASAVLKAQAGQIAAIQSRLEIIKDKLELDNAETEDKLEFMQLNKLLKDINDSVIKTYQIIDKKIFPARKEELASAVLAYKLDTLEKMLNAVKVVLAQYQNDPAYAPLVLQLRMDLAKKFDALGDEILKSGGMLKANTSRQIETDDEEESREL